MPTQPRNTLAQPALRQPHVVGNGEKNVLGLFWKSGVEHIGVKYTILPATEQMSLSFEVYNLYHPTPRF